jgi:hypothetical protein
MVISILIREVFYFTDLKPVVSGHFLQICKDLLALQVLAVVMEKMEVMARMVLMERQLLMHQQQLQHQDLLDHKVKRVRLVQLVRPDLRELQVQPAHKDQRVHRAQVREHQDRKVQQVLKEQRGQQDLLVQVALLVQREVQEQRVQQDLLARQVQPAPLALREFLK